MFAWQKKIFIPIKKKKQEPQNPLSAQEQTTKRIKNNKKDKKIINFV